MSIINQELWRTYHQPKAPVLNAGLNLPCPSSPSSPGDHPAASAWNLISSPSGNIEPLLLPVSRMPVIIKKRKKQNKLILDPLVSLCPQHFLDGSEKDQTFHSIKLVGICLSCTLLAFGRVGVRLDVLVPLSIGIELAFHPFCPVRFDVKAIYLATGALSAWAPPLSKQSYVCSVKEAASVPSLVRLLWWWYVLDLSIGLRSAYVGSTYSSHFWWQVRTSHEGCDALPLEAIALSSSSCFWVGSSWLVWLGPWVIGGSPMFWKYRIPLCWCI